MDELERWLGQLGHDGLAEGLKDAVIRELYETREDLFWNGDIRQGREEEAYATYWDAYAEKLTRLGDWHMLQTAHTVKKLMENNRWTLLESAAGFLPKHEGETEYRFWRWWQSRHHISDRKMYDMQRVFGTEGVLWLTLPFLDLSNPGYFNLSRLEDYAPQLTLAAGRDLRNEPKPEVLHQHQLNTEAAIQELKEEGREITEEAIAAKRVERITRALQEEPTVQAVGNALSATPGEEVEVTEIFFDHCIELGEGGEVVREYFTWHVPYLSPAQHKRFIRLLGDMALVAQRLHNVQSKAA